MLSRCGSGLAMTSHKNTTLATLLISGSDEAQLQKLADDILNGREPLKPQDVLDNRAVARNVLLRAAYGQRDYQMGVSTISDYAICLLEIRHNTSTLSVLQRTAPSLARLCSGDKSGCDVCNSQSFPVDAHIKETLQQYWGSMLTAKE